MASFPLVRSPDRQWLSWNITPGADPRIDNPPVGARAPRRAVRRSETWIKRACDNAAGKPCQEGIPELFESPRAASRGNAPGYLIAPPRGTCNEIAPRAIGWRYLA